MTPETAAKDCRCQHRRMAHRPVGMDGRGECLHPRCGCRGYRAVRGEDSTNGTA